MKKSAGILLYRRFAARRTEVFLVHPGGPYWMNKDINSWSIPKGEFTIEEPIDAAIREFKEETGQTVSGELIPLKPQKQKSGKLVYAWAAEGNISPEDFKSNIFELEYPVGSGVFKQYPENDKGEWFEINSARIKIFKGQIPFIDELISLIIEPKNDKKNKIQTNPSQLKLF